MKKHRAWSLGREVIPERGTTKMGLRAIRYPPGQAQVTDAFYDETF